ncbi:Zinc Finger Rna-Binding Protein [Manis pentadactyla]|nr:Zinc Finger Rna-Binding Protein [Manis pentadactyla]
MSWSFRLSELGPLMPKDSEIQPYTKIQSTNARHWVVVEAVRVEMSNNKNNKNDDDDDDKVCQSWNTAVTTGSIIFPHRSDFGGTESTHLFDTMQLYRLATYGLNGDSDASLSKHFTALLSSPTQ